MKKLSLWVLILFLIFNGAAEGSETVVDVDESLDSCLEPVHPVSSVDEGEEIVFSVVDWNCGTLDYVAEVEHSIASTEQNETYSLSSNEIFETSMAWTPESPGTYTYRFNSEYERDGIEATESIEYEVTVEEKTDSPDDGTSSDPSPTPSEPTTTKSGEFQLIETVQKSEDSKLLNFSIENTGNVDLSNLELKTNSNSVFINSLKPDGEVSRILPIYRENNPELKTVELVENSTLLDSENFIIEFEEPSDEPTEDITISRYEASKKVSEPGNLSIQVENIGNASAETVEVYTENLENCVEITGKTLNNVDESSAQEVNLMVTPISDEQCEGLIIVESESSFDERTIALDSEIDKMPREYLIFLAALILFLYLEKSRIGTAAAGLMPFNMRNLVVKHEIYRASNQLLKKLIEDIKASKSQSHSLNINADSSIKSDLSKISEIELAAEVAADRFSDNEIEHIAERLQSIKQELDEEIT